MVNRAMRLLPVLPLTAVALLACETGGGTDHWAPLDYESNPASAKYDFEDVDATVGDFIEDYPTVEGVTLAIVRGAEGQVYEKGYGVLDRERISMIASTGKVLSVGIILALVDDGLLDLDRPVAEYLDWGDHHPGVTMRQILSMMAGLPVLINTGGLCLPHACECDPATTMQECGRVVFEDESMSIPPGEEFHYGRWQLAGAVAEVVSGKTPPRTTTARSC